MKKNQVIIATLAVMIAVAGYLNYSESCLEEQKGKETSGELANKELLDISEQELAERQEILRVQTRRRALEEFGRWNTGGGSTYKRGGE